MSLKREVIAYKSEQLSAGRNIIIDDATAEYIQMKNLTRDELISHLRQGFENEKNLAKMMRLSNFSKPILAIVIIAWGLLRFHTFVILVALLIAIAIEHNVYKRVVESCELVWDEDAIKH